MTRRWISPPPMLSSSDISLLEKSSLAYSTASISYEDYDIMDQRIMDQTEIPALPNDLLMMIFDELKAEERIPLGTVCKKFRELDFGFGKKEFTTISVEWSKSKELFRGVGHSIVFTLRAKECEPLQPTHHNLRLFRNAITNVLEISHCTGGNCVQDELHPMINYLKTLTYSQLNLTFNCSKQCYEKVIKSLSNLENVNVLLSWRNHNSDRNVYEIRDALKHLPQMKSIEIKYHIPKVLRYGLTVPADNCIIDDAILVEFTFRMNRVILDNAHAHLTAAGIIRAFEEFRQSNSSTKYVYFIAQRTIMDEVFATLAVTFELIRDDVFDVFVSIRDPNTRSNMKRDGTSPYSKMSAALIFLAIATIMSIVLFSSWRAIKDVIVMIWRSYFSLANMRGPKAYPLIGTMWQVKLNSADLTYQILNWTDTYAFSKGSTGLVKGWLGPIPVVLVAKPDNVKKLLESNTLITKAAQYGKLAEWIGTGLLISTNEKWFGRRKMLTPAFHFNVLKDYQEIFSKQAQIMVEQLESFADSGREVDVFPYVKRVALDIICETAMSTQLNAQIGKNSEYVRAVARLSDLIFLFIRSPWLWLKPVWYECGLGFEFDRLVKMTTDFTRQVIAERRQTLIDEGQMDDSKDVTKKKLSFLDLMLLSQEKNALSDEDIREEVDTFMFEGHDTTSSGMGWTIWLIGQYPEYQASIRVEASKKSCFQAKVHAEMDAVFGDDDREPSEADLKKLCPPVPVFARRLTHDLVLDGITIPKDVTTAILPMGTHRDPEQWQYPTVFYPDHFEPEAVAKRHPFAYILFSAGPRNCIGQKFALAEEKTVLSYLFRKYRVESVEPLPGNRFVPELILKPEEGVQCRIFKRVREL